MINPPPPGPGPGPDGGFTVTPASISNQPTATGRQSHKFTLVGDVLIDSYGDFDANTGPIDIVTLDLSVEPPTLVIPATLATEATWNYRANASGDEILAPYVDPRGGQDSVGHYARFVEGAWQVDQLVTPTAEHVMDAAFTTGSHWLSGSAYGSNPAVGGAATVWRSTDNCATWAASLELDEPDNTGFARFYLLMTFGDELLAVITDSFGANSTWHWDGSAWAAIDPVGPLNDGVGFNLNGTPYWLCRSNQLSRSRSSSGPVTVVALDGAVQATMAAAIPSGNVQAMAVSPSHAWLLGGDGRLYRIDTDGTVTNVMGAGNGATTAMAVHEPSGWVYLADETADIYRIALP